MTDSKHEEVTRELNIGSFANELIKGFGVYSGVENDDWDRGFASGLAYALHISSGLTIAEAKAIVLSNALTDA